MKILLVAGIAVLGLTQKKCSKKIVQEKLSVGCYKGRLEVKGICSNYTIKVIGGAMDTSKIVNTWVDETTQKTYTNVFALGSPCNFPSSLNTGDEFYFTIDSLAKQSCAVCMAYYPKPHRKLSIKVLDGPCK